MRTNNLDDLSQDWLLFYVAQEKIDQFKKVAQQSQLLINEIFSEKYPEVNMNVPVCNIWLALHEHLPNEETLFLNEHFGMAYRAGIFQIKYVEESKEINKYLNNKNLDENELVILSVYLVEQLMNWLEKIVGAADKNEIFELYKDEDQLYERLPSDYKFNESQRNQKIFQQIILKNVKDSAILDEYTRIALEKSNKCIKLFQISIKTIKA